MTTNPRGRYPALRGALGGATAVALILAIPIISLGAFHGDPPDENHPWAVHDLRRPAPSVVTPGPKPGDPPSDAIILFDGSSLAAWETVQRTANGTVEIVPATWRMVDGALEVNPKSGSLQTKEKFGACQLHIEWRTPVTDHKPKWGPGEGNSGVYFIGMGTNLWGAAFYEVQILDSYENPSYPDGQAAAVYGQAPPLVNASRRPGEWQSYDIVFHPPKFDATGAVLDRASITVFHNGVLVQDHWLFEGATGFGRRAQFKPHPDTGHILLQDYGIPIQFRNIWVRPLPARTAPTPAEVAATRQQTAAQIRAEAQQAGGRRRFLLLLESLVYADDSATRTVVNESLAALNVEVTRMGEDAIKKNADELRALYQALKYCVRHKILAEPIPALGVIEQKLQAAGIKLP